MPLNPRANHKLFQRQVEFGGSAFPFNIRIFHIFNVNGIAVPRRSVRRLTNLRDRKLGYKGQFYSVY